MIVLANAVNSCYLYGNKTFTTDLKYARKFDSVVEAERHKTNWCLTGFTVKILMIEKE